jgi:membrane protein implicated in regulation of membrane protease activity
MIHGKGNKSLVLFNIFTTAVEEAALLVVLLWLLPVFGIIIPLWIIIVLAVGLAVWSYLSYRIGARASNKTPVMGSEALVGVRCRTSTPLSPMGYVSIGNELWWARSISG